MTKQHQQPLDERHVRSDPIKQFALWFDEAAAAKMPFPHAMTLATATNDGKPSARVVLLKHFDSKGFVFYTNYNSPKSKDLKENPSAALVFYWQELSRQIRIEGVVEKISAKESDEYFQTRPRESQLGASASPQSEVIKSRKELEQRFKKLQRRYANQPIPRPPQWGGFRLKPTKIEFWQNREARLHDRIVYEKRTGGTWVIKRLAP